MKELIPVPEPEALEECAAASAARFRAAAPFPHVVVDGLFPPELLRQLLEEFPTPEDKAEWKRYADAQQVKLESTKEASWGPVSRAFFRYLNSQSFLGFLERLTGIPHLVPDPNYWGGGFHQIQRGGFLRIHADFNRHPETFLDRRLNLLLFLNERWEDAWGGHLELWSPDMRAAVERIAPVMNRMVIFATTSDSYHGHPDPLECPEHVTRRSLAMYYYSNGRPLREVRRGMLSHGTLFQRRPGEPAEVLEGAEPSRPPPGLWTWIKGLVPLRLLLMLKQARWQRDQERLEER